MRKTNNVRDLRWQKDFSLSQLARIAGMSRSTVSRIENFEVDPTRSQMIKLSKALKKPIGEVFDLERE